MVKTKNYVVLMAAVLSICLAGCEGVQQFVNSTLVKPSANLKNVALKDFNMQSATLLFDVEVDNPYSVALPLLNMDYNVASGANKLFSGKADLATSIPAKGRQVVSLPANVNYMDVINAFKGVRAGSKIPYKADLGLSTNAPAVGTLRLPLSKAGELAVPSETDMAKMLLNKLTK
jgi:LEA14-like dessication related protein